MNTTTNNTSSSTRTASDKAQASDLGRGIAKSDSMPQKELTEKKPSTAGTQQEGQKEKDRPRANA